MTTTNQTTSRNGQQLGTVALRKRVAEVLTAEQRKRWERKLRMPVGYWRAAQCEAAIQDPDCENPPVESAADPANRGLDEDPASELGSLLARMVQQVASESINEDRVRELIAEASDSHVSEEQVREIVKNAMAGMKPDRFEVKVGEAPEVTIKGTPHAMFAKCVKLAAAKNRKGHRFNIMLVGPAGCGKSELGRQIAEALGLRYGHLSLTAGISESSLKGRFVPTGAGGQFEYVAAQFADFYEHGGVFVLEEMDSADPNVLLVVNNALANGHLATDNPAKPVIERHPDFVCIACCNTWGHGADREYVGRNQLDAATLDRFACSTYYVDYDEALEKQIGHPDVVAWAQALRARVRELKIRRVVSTRMIIDGSDQLVQGVKTLEELKASILESWKPDELAKIGDLAV